MVVSTRYTAILLSLLPLATAEVERRAQLVPQLIPRATYNGGWAIGIEGTDCPDDTIACSTQSGYVNPTCCPKGQTCFGRASPYCCPSETDCYNVVTNFPVCGTKEWNLYIFSPSQNQYFCCPPGQVGILPVSNGNAGICREDSSGVALSLVATPVEATTGIAPKTTSTVTRTSTLADGGVTVVTEDATVTATSEATQTTDTETATETDPAAETEPASSGSNKSSSSSKTSSSKTKKKSKVGTGAIAGIVIAAVFLIISILFGIWLRRRNAKKNALKAASDSYVGSQAAGGAGTGGGVTTYDSAAAAGAYNQEYKSPAMSSVQGDGGQQTFGHNAPQPQGSAGYSGLAQPASGNRAEMGTGR